MDLSEDGDDAEDDTLVGHTNTDGGLHLESGSSQEQSVTPRPTSSASQPPLAPPPLSFLSDTREGEEKPAILKLLDSTQLSSSSFVMSSIKVIWCVCVCLCE